MQEHGGMTVLPSNVEAPSLRPNAFFGGPILAALTRQREEEARQLGFNVRERGLSASKDSAAGSASADKDLSPASLLHPPSPSKSQALKVSHLSTARSQGEQASTDNVIGNRSQRSASIADGHASGITLALRGERSDRKSMYMSATPGQKTAFGSGSFGLFNSKQYPSCPNLASLSDRHREQEIRSCLPADSLSLSDAKTDLYATRQTGWLYKKGFHWFKAWKKRWVVLQGRNLSYFDSKEAMTEGKSPRGSVELNHHFLELPSEEDGKHFGFKVIPVAAPTAPSEISVRTHQHSEPPSVSSQSTISSTSSGKSSIVPGAQQMPASPFTPNMQYAELVDDVTLDDAGIYCDFAPVSAPIAQADGDIWYLSAQSQEEGDDWIKVLKRSLSLIRRCDETRPTLSGMGTVHDHYIIGRVLGVGRFGVVREGANKHSKQLCAIKIINKKKHLRTPVAEKTVRNEIKLMRVIARVAGVRRHPGLVSLHECYEDDFLIYIVMDSVRGGDLLDNLIDMKWKRDNRKHLAAAHAAMSPAEHRKMAKFTSMYTERDVGKIMKQILEAVAALHDVGVIHRDIKPENILYEDSLENDEDDNDENDEESAVAERDAIAFAEEVLASAKESSHLNASDMKNSAIVVDEGPRLKIADFSLAGTIRQFAREALAMGKKTIVGTPGYIAPEVLETGEYSPASDMYAIGVCLYTILAGYPPIAGGSDAEVFKRTKQGLWGFEKMDWENITPEARDLTWQLLSVDPKRRVQAVKALEHPWFDFDDLRCDVPLVGARSRLRQFNSKRKLKAAAFAKLLSSRKAAARRASFQNNGVGGMKRTLSNGGLKALVRGMAPSPSCPDLKAMTRADSGRNLASMSKMPGASFGSMGAKRDPYVGTETIDRSRRNKANTSKLLDEGTGESSPLQRPSRYDSTGVSQSSESSRRSTLQTGNRLSGMRRSHTTGQNLANLANFKGRNITGGNFKSVLDSNPAALDSISESVDERGSYVSNGSMPHFAPGSLSMFSDDDMQRIGMNSVRSSSRSSSTLHDSTIGASNTNDSSNEHANTFDEETSSIDSPLGF